VTIAKVQTIRRHGKKEFAVLPYADFLKLQAALDDYGDLRSLREARAAEANAPTISLAEAKRRLLGRTPSRGVSHRPRR
jgi:hypothetical protein